MKKNKFLVAVLALPLALAACTSTSSSSDSSSAAAPAEGSAAATAAASAAPAAGGEGYGYNIAVVTHGGAGDAFWSVVKAGAEKAGADLGDNVQYQSDGDPQKQAQLIDAAVSQGVQGLVVSMANPDALKDSIAKATAAGIPVITINAGGDKSKEFGAMNHIGQDEAVAGNAVGAKMAEAGAKNVICVIQEAGNVALETRCQGVTDGLGGTVENLQVDNNDLTGAQATIKSKLQADPSIDGVVTLGGQMAAVAAAAVEEAGSSAKVGTFDVNSDVTALIKDGKVLFAVDQQPYLQGYMGVDLMTLYLSNANTLGGGLPVLTGPSFVTPENVDQISELAVAGTR